MGDFKYQKYYISLGKLLGKGGFAEVYLGEDKNTHKLYAVKKINLTNIDSKSKSYIENEIKILSMIKHPNIIKLKFTNRASPNLLYLGLEYCNGGSLYKNLYDYIYKYKTPFTEKLVQKIMRDILSGVKCLHENGVIHRDLKLDNILVNYKNKIDLDTVNIYNSEIKIIDFNISYRVNYLKPVTAVGTVQNMAPSIVLNMEGFHKTYDEKIDIWSLGTLCYEMLFGKPLFPYLSREQILNNILSCQFKIEKTISTQARSFLYCMLQKEGINRLTAKQLLNHEFIIGDYHTFIRADINQINFNNRNQHNNIIRCNSNYDYNYNIKKMLGDKINNKINNKIIINSKFKCVGCGKNLNDCIIYKCLKCYSLIVCENCFYCKYNHHEHPFQTFKRKDNPNLPKIIILPIKKAINNKQYNIVFEENGKKTCVLIEKSGITVNSLINFYLERVNKTSFINNYKHSLKFIYNDINLCDKRNEQIEKVFHDDNHLVRVINLRQIPTYMMK